MFDPQQPQSALGRDRFPVFVAVLAATAGAYYFGGSRIYLGDLYAGGFALLALGWVMRGVTQDVVTWMAAVSFFLFGSVSLDLINRIPRDDLYRGGFRNFVFGFVAFASYAILKRYGRRAAAIIFILLYMSLPLAIILLNPNALGNIDLLFRWDNGVFLALPLQFFVGRAFKAKVQQLLANAVLFSALGTYAYFSDLRSVAALLVVVAAIELLSSVRYLPKQLRVPMVVGVTMAFAAGFVFWYASQEGLGEEIYKRREASNSLRVEMALDAWDSFLAHPWTGNGSWQHARSFVDPSNTDTLIGVHSTVLQFAYEYGLLGLTYILFLLWVQVRALIKLISVERVYHSDWLYGYILVMGVYHTVMSPFAGAQRFTLGVSVGVACSLVMTRDPRIWTPVRRMMMR